MKVKGPDQPKGSHFAPKISKGKSLTSCQPLPKKTLSEIRAIIQAKLYSPTSKQLKQKHFSSYSKKNKNPIKSANKIETQHSTTIRRYLSHQDRFLGVQKYCFQANIEFMAKLDLQIDFIKKALGIAAADLIKDGMHVGLGSGSTSACFIDALIKRCQQGLKIQAIASSKQSFYQAQQGGIPLLDFDQIPYLDITVDGADEIDPQKRMIKGGGGALVREKIVASSSKEMVVIVDERKLVPHLGKCPLPVEIVTFGYQATMKKMEKLGYRIKLRKTTNGSLFVTDNHNYIVDIAFNSPLSSPENVEKELKEIPGVVDTGFFFHLAGRVLIGHFDGTIEVRRDENSIRR